MRWEKRHLTWRLTKLPTGGLLENEVKTCLKKAFRLWSRYADLHFSEDTVGRGDLEIRFERGDHGDGDPFDR